MNAAREKLLEVKGLNVTLGAKSRPVHVLGDVDIDVAPGQTVCIVGESGCGMSMTALALMGLLPAGAVRETPLDYKSPVIGHTFVSCVMALFYEQWTLIVPIANTPICVSTPIRDFA